MHKLNLGLLFGALALTCNLADAQTNMRVRGTVTAFDGKVVSVKSVDGKELSLTIRPVTGF